MSYEIWFVLCCVSLSVACVCVSVCVSYVCVARVCVSVYVSYVCVSTCLHVSVYMCVFCA